MATPFERALMILLFVVTVLATVAVLGLRGRIVELESQLEHQKIVNEALGSANERMFDENQKFRSMLDDGALPRAVWNGEFVRL
jgi:hypothetical protein